MVREGIVEILFHLFVTSYTNYRYFLVFKTISLVVFAHAFKRCINSIVIHSFDFEEDKIKKTKTF